MSQLRMAATAVGSGTLTLRASTMSVGHEVKARAAHTRRSAASGKAWPLIVYFASETAALIERFFALSTALGKGTSMSREVSAPGSRRSLWYDDKLTVVSDRAGAIDCPVLSRYSIFAATSCAVW